MSSFDFNRNRASQGDVFIERGTNMDLSLRGHMLRVYNYMGLGLGISGLLAYIAAYVPSVNQAIFGTPLVWLVMLAPLAFVLVLSFGINRMSAQTAKVTFFAFSAAMGLSLASIFMVYTGESILRVFFISAAMFAATSLYGYTTRKDLTGVGGFMIMGLFGIIIASIVNMFLHSSALQFGLSILGVLIFTGLTAYDTQRIKMNYASHFSAESQDKLAVTGALSLYLNFINLFMMMMRLAGDRR